MLPVHECVPFAGIQVTLSVLSSTLWMPTSSEAFPATVIVTVGVKTKLEFLGELMAICGGVVSGIGSPARTSTVIETVWTRLPCRAVPKTATVYHPSAVPRSEERRVGKEGGARSGACREEVESV